MTLIPYPNNPSDFAAVNPIFNDNGFVRGDEQRLNNTQTWANFIELDTILELVKNTYLFKGLLEGGVEFDTASTFPSVKDGTYEVNNKLVYKASSYNIQVTDTFFNNRQAFEANVGYLILMNELGEIKYLLNGEGIAQASQTVSASIGTTSKTLTVASVPGSGSEDYIALIAGNGSYTGAFKATRLSATSFSIVLTTDPGNSITDTTVTLFYKIRTLHGTGSFANITDSNSNSYSPSLGENGETNSFGLFDVSRKGFYCTLAGLTNYRIIGSIAGASSISTLQPTSVFSFKSGRNKNDNNLRVNTVSAMVTQAPRWSNIETAFGCDYVFYRNDATFGHAILLKRPLTVSGQLQTSIVVSSTVFAAFDYYLTNLNYITVNSYASSNSSMNTGYSTGASGFTLYGASMPAVKLNKNSAIKVFINTGTTTGSNNVRAVFDFQI